MTGSRDEDWVQWQRDIAAGIAVLGSVPESDQVEETAGRLADVLDLIDGLTDLRHRLNGWLSELVGYTTQKELWIDGVLWRRNVSKARRAWDTDDLRRRVMDSLLQRVTVDPETGEKITETIEETPVDKILHVWNLGAPRTTALRARGIDPDEYCEAGEVTVTFRPVRGDLG